MFEEAMAAFIKEVGVPVAAFILMYVLYVQNQKWQQKQQEKTETRFDKLVDRFITTVKEITDGQNLALERHTAAIDSHTAKLEEHVKAKDNFMEFIKEERRNHG